MGEKTISVYDFMRRFPDEEAARIYLESRRWREGISCPLCRSSRTTVLKEQPYYLCKDCQRKFTIRTGTIFERSHIPLHKWLYAMYCVATVRKGVSSLQLSKELGITQKSAWFMLQRIREACGEDSGELLDGVVEIDETYIGRKERNKHASKKTPDTQRGSKTKSVVVVGMKERGGKAMPIRNTQQDTLRQVVSENIVPGPLISTDESSGYDRTGYARISVNHSVKQFVDGMASANGVESVWAILKRMHYGTHHHFSRKHLKRYVDECAFRLNEGSVQWHTMDRVASLCDKAFGRRITYARLIA